ncbi:MAG: phenylacetate--CoA ligase [Spirochaetales bacterium]|nr:phenylacetate--CoA ligase [Spirochaetales bacterium]MCF7938037.1 phenylacetate--CoA ligase [Spirochaetales bacterium]
MIWKSDIEQMEKEPLQELQSERLRSLLKYLSESNAIYRERLAEVSDISGVDIQSIDRLPFTTKEDMRDTYPFGLFSSPEKDILELHVSSGTTGNPTLVGYTKEDLDIWADAMARSLAVAGAKPADIIQIAYGYGLFTGGLGFHYGALEMGLRIIPTSSGQTRRQLKIMQDFQPRILACTPSYALYMADEARDLGLNTRESSWEIGIFGAEPWSDSIRKEIEEVWNITALDVYGLSEIIGPGVAQECPEKNGLHVYSDLFYPEVIDPDSGEQMPDGKPGELVLTTLTKRGIPLLRYRTRDIVTINHSRCGCGRTSPRISKVLGRTDDMIVVRGINVFPSQIEHVLMEIEGTQPHYQLVVDRQKNNMDSLEVLVEVEERFFSDEIKQLRAFQETVREAIQSTLGVGVKVRLMEPRSLERSQGKSKRVVDKRQFNQKEDQ